MDSCAPRSTQLFIINNDHAGAATNFTKAFPGSLDYFEVWINELERTLSVPKFEGEEQWRSKLSVFEENKDMLENASNELEKAKKRKDSAETVEFLERELQTISQSFEESRVECEKMAASVLQGSNQISTFLTSSDESDVVDQWVTWRVLKSVDPLTWHVWCEEDSQEISQDIIDMLHSPNWLRCILLNGGPRKNCYRNFLKIHKKIVASRKKRNYVLERLAMAVSLEFASNDHIGFGQNTPLDPIQRYAHYETAYLVGELDPNFPMFSVWEMRMIVDSNATNEDLAWGRRCLVNYRPDLILMSDDKWRYNRIVKTDIPYKAPTWYNDPKTYDQILSGGGKCGPQAWYGRFICKAFGIPTWGFRQVGHAAMSRWTPNGWVTCLGAAFHRAFWEGRHGTDFKLETDTRRACGMEATYGRLVQRLEWLAFRHGEKRNSVQSKGEPTAKHPWTALMLFQCRILISEASARGERENWSLEDSRTNDSLSLNQHNAQIVSKIQIMQQEQQQQRTLNPSEPTWDKNSKTLVVPADCCCDEETSRDKQVKFLPSFLGGQQVYLQGNGVLTYILDGKLFSLFDVDTTISNSCWYFSLRFCSVHRGEEEMKLTLFSTTSGESSHHYCIPLGYSRGEWQYTKPVLLELIAGKQTKICLSRTWHEFGIAIMDITFSSVGSDSLEVVDAVIK